MNADDIPESPDEELTFLLAARDDSLAEGKVPAELAGDGDRGLEHDLAFLHKLRQTLRRPTAAAPSHPAAEQPLTSLDRFTIVRELGRGGFGVVYLARDPLLNREVALKVPRAEVLALSEWRVRFRREAQAAAGLDHPNIVPIHEAGEAGSVCFLVSAYCPGPTLAQWLRERNEAVPCGDAAALVATLADAVRHAHERGVIHRDLKPANILLASGEIGPIGSMGPIGSPTTHQPKITDFGLAKLLDAKPEEDATCSGAIMGTASYMAPEQAAGKKGDLGPGADIYALGVILYELLTGRPPFHGDSDLEILLRARAEEVVPLSRLRPSVPRDLETICLKCLQKEPWRRYASARDLADDLRRFLEGKPVLARRAGLPERVVRWARRNPLAAGLTGSVAALLVVVAMGSLAAAVTFQRERDRAVDAQEETRKELAWSLLAQARAWHRSSLPGRHFIGLAKLDEAVQAVQRRGKARPPEEYPSLLDLRDAAINCLARADLHLARRLATSPEIVRTGMDDRLEHFATIDEQGIIRLCRVADEQEVRRVAGTPVTRDYTQPFRLGPDGRFLAVVQRDRRLGLWDFARGERVPHDLKPVQANALDFHPDGRALAVGHDDGTISIYDLEERRLTRRLPRAGRVVPYHLLFAPDGKRLAAYALTYTNPANIQVRDAATGDVLTELPQPVGVWNACWSRDGRRLALGCHDCHIRVWDVDAARETLTLKGHTNAVVNLAINSAGDLLASSSWDGTLRLWDLVSGELRFTTRAAAAALRFSPDGRQLGALISLFHIGLWNVAAGREYSSFEVRPGAEPPSLSGGGLSPDGRLLAVSVQSEYGVRLWEVASRREIAFLPTGQTAWVQFAPDGQALYTSGLLGLYRWPIHAAPDRPGFLRIGPPEKLLPEVTGKLCFDEKGRALAVATNAGGAVLRLDGPPTRGPTLAHPRAISIALSPDGDWAATGTLNGHGIKVWDARTGREEKTLLAATRVGQVFFSPDGQWLLTSTEQGYQFWRTKTWEPGRQPAREDLTQMPGWAAFAPDGGLLAVEPWPGRIRLLDQATGADLATLDDPELTRVDWMTFNQDGTHLVVKGGADRLGVWDLRRVRARLAERNLDWAPRASAPPDPRPQPVGPVQVELTSELYTQRGRLHALRREWPQAVADYQEALRHDPNEAMAANNLAWLYAIGPVEYRDAAKALPLAQRAALRRPRQFTLNTLGVVYYRLGQWQDAVVTLRAAGRADRQPASACDLYFLAMGHHRLGDVKQAREYFERAGALHQQARRPEELAELDAFRVEAELVLELANRGADDPGGEDR